MIELLGMKSQPFVALDLEQTYWRTFLSHAELFPQVTEVLVEIRSLGLPLAMVTDLTAQIQFRKLVSFNIDRYFDYVVTSEETGVDKSGLVPYRVIGEKLGLGSGDRVWVIGDARCDTITPKDVLNAVTIQKLTQESGWAVHDGVDAAFRNFGDLWSLFRRWADQEDAALAAAG